MHCLKQRMIYYFNIIFDKFDKWEVKNYRSIHLTITKNSTFIEICCIFLPNAPLIEAGVQCQKVEQSLSENWPKGCGPPPPASVLLSLSGRGKARRIIFKLTASTGLQYGRFWREGSWIQVLVWLNDQSYSSSDVYCDKTMWKKPSKLQIKRQNTALLSHLCLSQCHRHDNSNFSNLYRHVCHIYIF